MHARSWRFPSNHHSPLVYGPCGVGIVRLLRVVTIQTLCTGRMGLHHPERMLLRMLLMERECICVRIWVFTPSWWSVSVLMCACMFVCVCTCVCAY